MTTGGNVKKDGTTAVTTTEKPGLPAVIDFSADKGMGTEGADRHSFAIPFILMLQGQSPQLDIVEDAKPGWFINSITNELAKEILVVPCAFQRRFNRWAPRENGGGYKGDYSPLDLELNKIQGVEPGENGNFILEGDELKDTRNHYVLVKCANGVWQPAVISLVSTQIKKSKRWLTRIQGIELRDANNKPYNPPSFSHIYKLTPIKEENSQGSWWGIEVSLDGPVTDAELYAKAKTFHQNVIAGMVETAPPQDAPAPPSDGKF
jgi:hypothetical protein